MRDPRVYELAKELGTDSKEVLALLRGEGTRISSASSHVPGAIADRLRLSFTAERRANEGASAVNASWSTFPVTPPSLLGWHAAPVKSPRTQDLLTNIARIEREFPAFKDHREALQALGSAVVFAKLHQPKNSEVFGVALIRFSGAIESAFGFTREVLFFYSPYRDFQVRAYNVASGQLTAISRAITPDRLFIWAPDPRLKIKLDDWSSNSLQAIPLDRDFSTDPVEMIRLIKDYVYARDLFYETSPVVGEKFFGRRALLQSLSDDVKNRRVSGLFGLRKAGKTSVMKQLASDLDGHHQVTVLIDLEGFPCPPEDPVPDILRVLRRKLVEELKSKGLKRRELSDLGESFSIVDFRLTFQTLLSKLEADGVSVLIMLDEIEYLTPAESIDIAEGPMPSISQLLGALRSLAQEVGNFTFLLSGLTSAIVESGRLYGRPNPLFAWAKQYYLRPFDKNEAAELAVSVSGKMGIEIKADALDALFEASGGHAYLYRNLASEVVRSLPLDTFRRIMTRPDVLRALTTWQDGITGNVKEMIDHVRRYYPTEDFLLSVLMEDPAEFREYAKDEALAVRHLMGLGLIGQDSDSGYRPNSLLELMPRG